MVSRSVTVYFCDISSAKIYLRLILITCAEILHCNFFSKVFFKLHLYGKIQIILVYYLYYERDFGFRQTFLLVMITPDENILKAIKCFGVAII